MKFTRRLLGQSNQKGMALLLAMFTVMIITYLAMELIYDTNVEYIVNAGAVSRLKAYYAAKSGLEVSLLRIKLFNKVQKQFGSQIPPAQRKLLDLIWQFPFAWPPVIPEDASGVDKDLIKDKVKEASMDASYVAIITDEGSKIDVNDLSSPSKGLREITKRLLMQIFENRRQNDEEWARSNEDLRFEEIINNLADWQDADVVSLNGGDERQLYANLESEKPLPPNRGFRTVDEMRMVAGMTEEVFSMLKERVTVYGMRSINPNHASAEVLKALDVSMKDEVISKVLARREEQEKGPFTTAEEFWGFVNAEGGNVSPETQKAIPLIFDKVTNFKIKSTGESAGATREIEAVVFDFASVGSTIATRLQKEAETSSGVPAGAPKNQNSTSKANEPLPKGPPRIVYLIER